LFFDIDLTNQTGKLDDKQDYLLYFTIEGENNGRKVTGRIDVNYYYKNPDVEGLFDFDKLEQYPHPEPFEEGVTTGFTNALTFNESGMMTDGRFWVLKNATLNSLKFDVVVYDFANNTWDSLRSLEIDLSDQTLANGVQQISLDSVRGYVLDDGDIFNYLKITTDTNDGTKQFYNIQVGYKIPWQSWNEFKNAPTDFYDKSKPLNGLNQKASNYSLTGNYGIKVLFDAVVDSTNYVKTSEEINVYDYDNQNDWTCDIQTYKKDPINEGEFIAIEGNIIQNDYTQVQAVFTPLVPPVFSSSVDFTEVATLWNRFAHGNKYIGNGGNTTRRLSNWLNDQADDLDTFENSDRDILITKNDSGLYLSDSDKIEATENMGAFYGCYSVDKYENYSINGNIFSLNTIDNDVIAYQIAFMTDENGVEHTLSLIGCMGGILLDKRTGYDPNDDSSDIFEFSPSFPNNQSSVALVYDFGKGTVQNIEQFYLTGKTGLDWGDVGVGDLGFNINRSGDNIVASIDWTITGDSFSHVFNYNLNSNPLTSKFKGFQNIGFSFFSQDQGGFKDVVLSRPDGDFYSIIRIEPKNSQSDNVINEISSLIEAPENNLLTQITGDSKLATLEYDSINERFVCKCLVDTSQIQSGQEYDFSTEIRPRNLESI